MFYIVKMEAAGPSVMLIPMYETAWCHVPEDCNLNAECFGSLKS